MNKNSDLNADLVETEKEKMARRLREKLESAAIYAPPSHYGPASDPYEAIKVIEAWRLNFSLGNVLKYIARAGKKGGPADHVADLEKAAWYLKREIERVKKEKAP